MELNEALERLSHQDAFKVFRSETNKVLEAYIDTFLEGHTTETLWELKGCIRAYRELLAQMQHYDAPNS